MSNHNYEVESMVSEVSQVSFEEDHQLENIPVVKKECDENVAMNGESDFGRLPMAELNLHPTTPNMSSGKKSQISSGKSMQGLVGIGATINENKELKNQIQLFRAELQVATYREREAISLLSREVEDVIEEYYSMQLRSLETDTKLQELDQMKTTLQQISNDRDDALNNLAELQLKTQKDMELYEMEFDRMNKQLESARTQGSTGYEDFTLASTEADPDVADLEQKLNDALNENSKLLEVNNKLQKNVDDLTHSLNEIQLRTAADQTNVVISNNEREQELLAKIDEIEQSKKSMIGAIQVLMQSESALKKKLERRNASESLNDTPQMEFTDRDELIKMVTRLETELTSLRTDNWKMREECAKLKGGELDFSLEDTQPTSSSRNEANESNVPSQIEEQLNMIRNMNQLMMNDYGLDFNNSNFEAPAANGSVPANVSASFSGRPRISTDFGGLATAIDLSQTFANASCADILQVSINTSEDVHIVKVKLESLKDLLVSMFERLRGSAAVLDEVYKYLSNGSAENKAIADKIRQMNLEFSALSFEDSTVEKAVADAEKSMSQLQDNLSVLEQSLNQSASFMMDASRRFSTAHNLSRIQQAPEVASGDANEKMVAELQEKIAVTEASLQEMKALVSETKTKLVEVTKARDDALSSADSFRNKVEDVIQGNTELMTTNEQLTVDLENAQEAVSSLNTQIQELTETYSVMEQKTEGLEEELSNSHKNYEDALQQCQQLELEMQDFKLAVCKQCRSKTSNVTSRAIGWIKTKLGKSEIAQKLVLTTEELEKTKADLADRRNALEELHLAKEECINKLNQIEVDNKHLRSKFAELEVIADQKERSLIAERDRIIEESLCAKETMSVLGKRVAELETALEEYQSKDDGLSQPVFELSSLTRVNNEKKTIQTELTAKSIDGLYSQSDRLQKDLDQLHSVYVKLANAVDGCVNSSSNPVEINKEDMNGIESVNAKLIDLLHKHGENTCSTREQNDDLQNSSDDSTTSFKYKHQETHTDSLKYNSKLRQDFYMLTSLSMDLTANIKSAERILQPQTKVDLMRIVNDSRKIRNELNDRLTMITRSDKENILPQTMAELVDLNHIVSAQNENLHSALKENQAQLEAIKKEVSKAGADPSLLIKIQEEIAKIEKVMSVACEGVRKVPILGKKK